VCADVKEKTGLLTTFRHPAAVEIHRRVALSSQAGQVKTISCRTQSVPEISVEARLLRIDRWLGHGFRLSQNMAVGIRIAFSLHAE